MLFLKVQPEAKEAFGESYCDDQLLIIDKLQNISPLTQRFISKNISRN